MDIDIKRGQIYFVCLDPVFGREIGGFKSRPVVVVSLNDIHSKTRIVTVVPGTKAASKPDYYGRHRNFLRVARSNTNGLTEDTYFLCHQVRAIDQGRMTHWPVGRLSREDMQKLERSLGFSLGLSLEVPEPSTR